MNRKDFQNSNRKNSSSDKKCIKSINIIKKGFDLTPSKHNTNSNNRDTNSLNCNYNSANKKSKEKKCIFMLSSKHTNSIKEYINFRRTFNLLEKKMKTIDEEKRKIMCKINNKDKIEKLKEERKNNYNKRKNFLSNLLKEREKELEEKKNKVKMRRNQEYNRIKSIVIYKKINSESLSVKKRMLKKKILQDISEEKNKINEEKKRKMNLIKILDEDINKRNQGKEKAKKLIEKEKLEQEIKFQENLNKKLALKIYEYQNIGLEKIDFLQKIKLKLENKF